jgi:large subunit ribosomal protein L21
MYAVLKTGGKQYRVEQGDRMKIEKISGAVGDEVRFNDVLMIGGVDNIKIGRPHVEGAVVVGRILEQDRSKKVIVYKVKRRKKFRKTQGHRQAFSRVEITGIESA